MGFFRNLLGKSDTLLVTPANAVAIPASAPHHIGYDPKLVDSLLRDHAELGRIFANIGEARKNGSFDDVRSLLVQFKTRLEAHVLTENVRFYNYLAQTLGGDPESASTMHSFRRDMNGIARSVVEFVRKYQSSKFTPEEQRQFASDYATVGGILEQRLDSEENSLYPMYQA